MVVAESGINEEIVGKEKSIGPWHLPDALIKCGVFYNVALDPEEAVLILRFIAAKTHIQCRIAPGTQPFSTTQLKINPLLAE